VARKQELRIPGPQAGTLAHNRRFWDDPYVEPKQQHRFVVNFPVYMPMGPGDDSTEQAAKYFTNTPKFTSAQLDKVKQKVVNAGGAWGQVDLTTVKTAAALTTLASDALYDASTAERRDTVRNHKSAKKIINDVFGARANAEGNAAHFMVGPKGARYGGYGRFTSQTSGLYLRISEYIGYSFTPPALQFTQGFDPESNAGNPRPNDALNKYNLGDATLTLVTTLRDDLHFSLNFLFAVAAGAGASDEGHLKSPTKLYPSAVYAGAPSDKVLVIKEYSARQDTAGYGGPVATADLGAGPGSRPAANIVKGRKAGKTAAEIFGTAPARIVGIHKLNDPIIKSATFDEFTYGGTNLIKVTLVLGYGTTTGMSEFYSYETTTSRYQRSYFTWQDDTDSQKDSVPDFNKRKLEAFRERPNWWSKDRVKATQKLNAIKPGYPTKPGQGSARTGPYPADWDKPIDIETNKRRLDFIRNTVEKGEPIPINELVTKGVADLLQAKEAAERAAANEAEEARQREHDNLISNRAYAERQAESARYSEEIREKGLAAERRVRQNRDLDLAYEKRNRENAEVQRLEQRLGQGDDRRVEGAGRIGSGRDPVRSRREEAAIARDRVEAHLARQRQPGGGGMDSLNRPRDGEGVEGLTTEEIIARYGNGNNNNSE